MVDYINELVKIVGEENVRTDALECLTYGRDMSVHEGIPEVIVFPRSTDHVVSIMKLANEHGIAVTARGSGTSVTGGVLPVKGGIVLDMTLMDKIREIMPEDMLMVVETGVICAHANAALKEHNLFFPPDPGSSVIATIGGMAATNASGVRAVKFGTAKDWIVALEVVMADGTVIRTGTKAPKSSSGYDLTKLFICSEGTLGIITELTLKLLPIPPYVAVLSAAFDSIGDAGRAVSNMLSSGLDLSCCEIMDRDSLKVIKTAMKLDVPDYDGMILMEIDGEEGPVKEQIKRALGICKEEGAVKVTSSDDPQERAQIWRGRSGLVPSFSRLKPGSRLIPIAEDFGVPPSKIPEAIEAIQEIAKRNDITIATFGHVGDGNLHSTFISDPRSKEDWDKIRKVGDELIDMALRLGGTITAEHGTGLSKAAYIRREQGAALDVMWAIKKALDPKNILNPGKMAMVDGTPDIYDYFAFKRLIEDPDGITSFGTVVDTEILACIQCGFCRAGCPVFAETHMESFNAKGFVTLAFNLYSGGLEPSAELADKFYHCLACMNCKFKCPAGINIPEIVLGARKRLVEAGLMPEVFETMMESMKDKNNAFDEPVEKRTEFYPDALLERTGAEAIKDADVVIFAGCVGSYQDMSMLPAMVKILKTTGVKYAAMGDLENCCGFPAFLVGNEAQMKEAIKRNEALFKELGITRLLTQCSGCYRFFKEIFPEHSDHKLEVFHTVQYLLKLAEEGKLTFKKPYKKKVIYHDPCDIGRHCGVFEEPRELLKKVPDLELLEFPENRNFSKCCGGGGGFKAYDTEMSQDIAVKKVNQALALGAEIITSACPTCKDNMSLAVTRLKKEGVKGAKGLKVIDITEILAKAV
jgi:glycolate oxidase